MGRGRSVQSCAGFEVLGSICLKPFGILGFYRITVARTTVLAQDVSCRNLIYPAMTQECHADVLQ